MNKASKLVGLFKITKKRKKKKRRLIRIIVTVQNKMNCHKHFCEMMFVVPVSEEKGFIPQQLR